jgi:hypothetical protein
MNKRWIFTSVVAAAFAFSAGCNHMMHKEKEEEEEGNEVKMTMDQVPPAVKATLMQQAGGATIKTVDKEEGKNGTVYETDVMQDGKNWEIRVAPDGKLISRKVDNEEGEKSSKKEKDEEDEKEEHK